ncbi:hypothetical protein L9F63_027592, partial [Diploptera punctata]
AGPGGIVVTKLSSGSGVSRKASIRRERKAWILCFLNSDGDIIKNKIERLRYATREFHGSLLIRN